MALNLPTLEGMTPMEKLTGDTQDISFLVGVEFGWWDRVWYIKPTDSHERRHIGQWLGPSTTVGSAMSSWILTNKAQEIVCSSIFPLSSEDLRNDQVKQKCQDYDKTINERLQDRIALMPPENDNNPIPTFEPYEDDSLPTPEPIPEADNFGHEAFDKFISAKVMLPSSDGMMQAIVHGRK